MTIDKLYENIAAGQYENLNIQADNEQAFKADLAAAYGVTSHPKFERAYTIACSLSGGNMLSGISDSFSDIRDLLRD